MNLYWRIITPFWPESVQRRLRPASLYFQSQGLSWPESEEKAFRILKSELAAWERDRPDRPLVYPDLTDREIDEILSPTLTLNARDFDFYSYRFESPAAWMAECDEDDHRRASLPFPREVELEKKAAKEKAKPKRGETHSLLGNATGVDSGLSPDVSPPESLKFAKSAPKPARKPKKSKKESNEGLMF